jgi:hypothetical protein
MRRTKKSREEIWDKQRREKKVRQSKVRQSKVRYD